MADGARPTRGDSDVPEDPRGLERAFASTVVDSEATGPRTVETRGRANWPVQGNATEPRPPSQKPTRTRDVEGEPPWEGINEQRCQRRGTEARQADSVRNAAAHRKTHLPGLKDFSQRGGVNNDDTYTPETKLGPPRAITTTANRLRIGAKADVEEASPRAAVQELFKLLSKSSWWL